MVQDIVEEKIENKKSIYVFRRKFKIKRTICHYKTKVYLPHPE